MHWVLAFFVGLFVGIFSGVFGLGGGIIIIPTLIILFGMNAKQAVGASLTTIVPLALMGAIQHYMRHNFALADMKKAAVIGIASLITVPLGALVVSKLRPEHLPVFTRILGFIIICLAARLLILGK